jgi:UDP-glucose 4-epimerase
MKFYEVVGLDKTPCSTADIIGDIRDQDLLIKALDGVDVIVHTAALHAPHVDLITDEIFKEINVEATENLFQLGVEQGIKHFVFTSSTAVYGYASTPEGITGWVDEKLSPQPKSIYHRTKFFAENRLQDLSKQYKLPVTVIQMSRCFPEPADWMCIYRMTRGVDARDVASAHRCAIDKRLSGFRRYIISGRTPFTPADCPSLYSQADKLIKKHNPGLVQEFEKRAWSLPKRLDRVYDSSLAQSELNWHPQYDYKSVLEMLDNEIAEVLPVKELTL